MINKKLKLILLFLSIILLSECGYVPIYSAKDINFNIQNSLLSGDKEIGQDIVNRITRIEPKQKENNKKIILDIYVEKNKSDAVKDKTGKIITYKMEIKIIVKAKLANTEEYFYTERLINSLNYDKQTQISETVNLEKSVIRNIISKLANDIILRINQSI